MNAKDHSAVQPAIGYEFQFNRATYRLLAAEVDVVEIGIEDVDDVSEHRADGSETREQDKWTGLRRSPLSDRSSNLWKSLAIWCEAALSGGVPPDRTELQLVTNGRISPNSLVNIIGQSKSQEAALDAARRIKAVANDIASDPRSKLGQFAKSVLALSTDLLAGVVIKIDVLDRVRTETGGDLDSVPTLRYFPERVRPLIFNQARGWVTDKVVKAVALGQRPRISRDEFDREMRALIRHFQVAPLLAMIHPVDPDTESFRSSGFVEQLNWIDEDRETINDAIIHYVQARTSRLKWTDSALIAETSIREYERDLVERWKVIRRQVSRRSWPDEKQAGKECFDLTMSQDTSLSGQVMPKEITCGSFHSLADFSKGSPPQIGWHPQYQRLVSRGGGDHASSPRS